MRIEDDHYYVYDNHIGRGPEFVNGVIRDYGVTYNVRCTIDRLGQFTSGFHFRLWRNQNFSTESSHFNEF